VAVQPDPFCRSRAKMERGARTARWCAWAVWTSERVGACGHAGRRFFAGFQQWICPGVLYTMVCSKTRLENFDCLSLDQTPSLSRTSSDTSCWAISRTQSHTIYVVWQLAYSTELLVCINEAYKQYKQRRRR